MGEWDAVAHRARTLRRMMLACCDGGRVFPGDTGLVERSPLGASIEAGLDERYRSEEAGDLLADVDSRFEDGLEMVLSGARQWLGEV